MQLLWARPRFSEKSGKRTMTYGPIWSQKWWEMVPDTHLQKSRGPMSDEKWSQHVSECRYQSISTRSIDHGRYRRSIRIHLTVDIDGRYGFTCRELRSMVDGGLKSEIILCRFHRHRNFGLGVGGLQLLIWSVSCYKNVFANNSPLCACLRCVPWWNRPRWRRPHSWCRCAGVAQHTRYAKIGSTDGTEYKSCCTYTTQHVKNVQIISNRTRHARWTRPYRYRRNHFIIIYIVCNVAWNGHKTIESNAFKTCPCVHLCKSIPYVHRGIYLYAMLANHPTSRAVMHVSSALIRIPDVHTQHTRSLHRYMHMPVRHACPTQWFPRPLSGYSNERTESA